MELLYNKVDDDEEEGEEEWQVRRIVRINE